MIVLPKEVIEGMDNAAEAEVRNWWEDLSEDAQKEFILLWDQRNESTALCAVLERGETVWRPLPIELMGMPIDPEDRADERLWKKQHYQYLTREPNMQFMVLGHTFHICRAHQKAQDILKEGRVPSAFDCPFEKLDCPWKRASELVSGAEIVLGFCLKRKLQ